MITRLDEIPALTESWIAPLRHVDRGLYDELAASIVIEHATRAQADWSPPEPSLAVVFNSLKIIGKEVGALVFPDDHTCAPAKAVEAFDRHIRASFDIDGEMMFVADYRQDLVFVTRADTGLLQREDTEIAAIPLARNFAAFLVAQCNAYDAYKRHIVEGGNVEGYFAEADAIVASGALNDADIAMIYDRQLKA